MEIKELHLRNIASIEKADIDFENGLKDEIAGNNANIFLISGDTGAGKSVILDGISMALYKKTPRIAGVMNPTKNEFTDAEGESIRVGSIEQYTRLGISEKDECYSEVAFVGNDGVDYRVKLSLGITKSNVKDASGKYPLHHSTPKWEMKVGNNGWTRTDESVILSAVGLTFQQFGRMAMLAQGQFASFLTGDKKEREAILEQLTNTEYFSEIGRAIESLFKKAREIKDMLEVKYNTESEHTLPENEIKELTDKKEELEKTKSDLDKEEEENNKTLTQVGIIETNRANADREKEEKTRLEGIVNGEDYKSKEALVNDWYATSTERQRLSDLKSAKNNLQDAKTEETKLKDTFTKLSADLQARRESLAAQGNPQKSVDEKQDDIDALNKKRDDLNPSKINSDLSELSDKKAKLSEISTKADNIRDNENAISELAKEIAEDETTNKANADAYSNAKEVHDTADAKKKDAERRLVTMQSGVEDAMIALRKRLADEHAEVCPLCGQKITEIHLDDEIRQIVTPLEKEYNKALEECSKAEKSLKAAKKTLDTFSGALKTKKRNLDERRNAVKAAKETLDTDAEKLGIDINKPLHEQIEREQKTLEECEEKLKELQKQAESLQTQITNAQKEKDSLDKALRKFNSDSETLKSIKETEDDIVKSHPDWKTSVKAQEFPCSDIASEWNKLFREVTSLDAKFTSFGNTISECDEVLNDYYLKSGKDEAYLSSIEARKAELAGAKSYVKETEDQLQLHSNAVDTAENAIREALNNLSIKDEKDAPQKQSLLDTQKALKEKIESIVGQISTIKTNLDKNKENAETLAEIKSDLDAAMNCFKRWEIINSRFGGTRFRTLVQTYILRPLLNNANIYLEKITDRYTLTCSEDNEQLSILVLDRYNKDQIRSVTVLSGGERFMISLALSLALSSLNRPDMNVNILFIDEGFGTLDEKSLDSVMETLEKLQEIAGQSERRVGIISHREELEERIPVQIQLRKRGEGRSDLVFKGISKQSLKYNCI